MKSAKFVLLTFTLILSFVLSITALAPPAIAQTTSVQTVILSNEGPGLALMTLANAGYYNYTIYQLLEKIVSESNPSLGNVITSSFLQSLQSAPASSKVLTKLLTDYDDYNAIAISTDGNVQTVVYTGSSYMNTQGTSKLDSQFLNVGNFRAVYSSTQTPLTSFTMSDVTYNVFAILYMAPAENPSPSASNNPSATPSTPEFPTLAIIPLAIILVSALAIAKKKKLIN